jgi:hypothetical protein
MQMKTYQTLARAIGARERCIMSNNTEWRDKWTALIDALVKEFPHGSGFDDGTKIDLNRSDDNCLMFDTAFWHMNENGVYDGWTGHCVIVRANLAMGYTLKITGSNRNSIKEMIAECFANILDADSTPIEIKLGFAKEVAA